MKNALEVLKKANVVPLLQLATRKEEGGIEGTGIHKVKLLEDKLGKRINPRTGQEEIVLWLFVEEDGAKKKYPIPVKDKNGEVHYLIQRLANFKEGEDVYMEYKKIEGTFKGYIDIRPVSESTEEPVEDTENIENYEDLPANLDEI